MLYSTGFLRQIPLVFAANAQLHDVPGPSSPRGPHEGQVQHAPVLHARRAQNGDPQSQRYCHGPDRPRAEHG